jgi:hypothetical protein
MWPFIKATMPRLKHKLINCTNDVGKAQEHCPPESVYRQTRKSLTLLKWSYIGIQSGVMPRLQFLDLHFTFARIYDSGITLHSASVAPSPKVSAVEEVFDGFKTLTYRMKTTTGAPAVITVKTSSAASYWCVTELCFITNYFK